MSICLSPNRKSGQFLGVITTLEVILMRLDGGVGVVLLLVYVKVIGEGIVKLHDNSSIYVHIIRLPTR